MIQLLPEGYALIHPIVWFLVQTAIGSIAISITLAAPFYVAGVVQRKFNQATREQYIISHGGTPLPVPNAKQQKVRAA